MTKRSNEPKLSISARNRCVSLIVALFLAAGCRGQGQAVESAPVPQSERGFVPGGGFVPTAEVAVRIAEAVMAPIYGEERIRRQQPLTAVLEGDVWVVSGTLPRGWRGGVARIEIRKRDAQILHLSHGR